MKKKQFPIFLAGAILPLLLTCVAATHAQTTAQARSTAPGQLTNQTLPAQSTTGVVYVPGEIDCSDHYSDRCGWGPIPSPGEGGGGGGGGGGGTNPGYYPFFNDDGTRGRSLDFSRFTEGCMTEKLFKDETVSQVAATGFPVGMSVDIGVVGDPLYAGGDWIKYESETFLSAWRRPDDKTMQRRVRIHYFFNHSTKQIAQVKFKNSYEYGCIGLAK